MIQVGICDDNPVDRETLRFFCEKILLDFGMEGDILCFCDGIQLLEYCEKKETKTIDLLFLDIEMEKLNGIQVKEKALRLDKIRRIVFVSDHSEQMQEAFGLKTIGFEKKPVKFGRIDRWIAVVAAEKEENYVVDLGSDAVEIETVTVTMEEILYVQSDSHFTKVYLHLDSQRKRNREYYYVSRNIAWWKQQRSSIIQVHKSYFVNFMHVAAIGEAIHFRNDGRKVPVGRTYRDTVRERYQEYIKEKIRKRLL